MEQAPELRDVYLRTFAAFATGDPTVYDALTSREEGVIMLGTDPDEWWEGFATVIAVLGEQLPAMRSTGMTLAPGDVRAYREGSVGWVVDRPRIRMPNGSELPLRYTVIFHQEDDAWKIVHGHVSIAVPNADVEAFRDVTTSPSA